MNAKGPESNLSVYAAAGLLGQLGLVVALPIILCGVAGKYLDAWLNAHGPLLLISLLFGVAVGAYGAYRLLAKDLNWKP